MDPDLQRNIAEASANGLNPMGYVGTRGGTRPIEEVKAEIDSWYKNVDVQGIYLGDSSNHQSQMADTQQIQPRRIISRKLEITFTLKGGIAAINGAGTPNQDYAGKFVQGDRRQPSQHARRERMAKRPSAD